ncbi:MAG: HD domain-containing protein [Flammeovirgaceae bacterium]|nr:HD domain-containing protein [Flammeovirgaceae bacterium]
MWNRDLYQKTIKYAGEAHSDQLVPGSNSSYLVHLSNVCMEVLYALVNSENLDKNLALQCALLHDTIEDTKVTWNDLNQNFGKKVADGVLALTKNKSLPKEKQMPDSISRILAEGPEIQLVKMADRITNLQNPPSHWEKDKIKRYHEEPKFIYSKLSGINPEIETRFSEKLEAYKKNF